MSKTKKFRSGKFIEVVLGIEKMVTDFLVSAQQVYPEFDYSNSSDKSFQAFFSGYLFDPADKDLLGENPEKVGKEYVKNESDKNLSKLVKDYFLYRVRKIVVEMGKNGH